jgi:hypothetical protein
MRGVDIAVSGGYCTVILQPEIHQPDDLASSNPFVQAWSTLDCCRVRMEKDHRLWLLTVH